MNTEKAIELAKRLENWFEKTDKVIVALSGGIDSSLVAFTARKQLGKEKTQAIISASASVKQKELTDARNFCAKYDILLTEVDANEINDANYRENPVNRCFFCKSALYTELEKIISTKHPDHKILNGNNYSDFGDFRPGLKAADDHHILSPLAECKFNKEDIRIVAQYYGLPNWNKPASPCLSSRFPYGESISTEKLRMVEKAEDLLNLNGFDDVRVRYTKNTARIEVPADLVPELKTKFHKLEPEILSFGFESCEIDLEGLVSGKLNRGVVSHK